MTDTSTACDPPPDAVLVRVWRGRTTVTLTYDAREVAQRRMIQSINESYDRR